ncbi:type 1 glutamine amidotransferase [Rhizobium sp. Root1220]|uniref:type 1 glutamine amidotransferase n=1 Tax=Rhizobium sp. Root1220 TaxID=1736432 RepID=UPI0006F4194E|nr:type 1 glutamine amidotransferase [Rhizobium sp. Root1220]KQV84533.1 glutamine amidotransferase [Rhizobium sp. Root1220]
MRVAVVENMKSTPLGSLGIALAEANAEIEHFRPWVDGGLPHGVFDHDALVVLGGEQNALDDENYPYLPALVRLMHRFSESGKAVLGICLGAQILARGYDAQNLLDAGLEFGWKPVEVTEEGKTDPLVAGLGPVFTTFQWHSDTFTLPAGASRLATSSIAENQAFRVGRAAYGLQFHFEASSAVVDSWKVEFQATIERMEPGWLDRYPALAAAHAAKADASGLAIARNWVRMIEAVPRQEKQTIYGQSSS